MLLFSSLFKRKTNKEITAEPNAINSNEPKQWAIHYVVRSVRPFWEGDPVPYSKKEIVTAVTTAKLAEVDKHNNSPICHYLV